MSKEFTVLSLAVGAVLLLAGKPQWGLPVFKGVIEGITKDGVSQPDPCAGAETHWKSAEQLGTADSFKDHLARFGRCAFASLATARLSALESPLPTPQPTVNEEALRAAERARQAAEDRKRQNEEAMLRAEAEQRARERATYQAQLRRIQQDEALQRARIDAANRIEVANRRAAEARGWKYVGNGISISPGQGY